MELDEREYQVKALRDLGAQVMAALDHQLDAELSALGQTFATKHGRLLAMTALFKETMLELRARGWDTHARLWNIGIYINMTAHDLSATIWRLCQERDPWARKLDSRHLALIVYEFTDDLRHMLGGQIRQALSTLGVLDNYDAELRSVRKPLDDFHAKHAADLNCIRIMAAAHREQDGIALLETVEQLDVWETISLGLELSRIVDDVAALLQRIFTETSKVRPPETTGTS